MDDAALLQTLPLLAGAGLCRALDAHLPLPCRLKWPNDLLVEVGGERRKIGGVLIEATVRPGEASLALIGFGINVFHDTADLPRPPPRSACWEGAPAGWRTSPGIWSWGWRPSWRTWATSIMRSQPTVRCRSIAPASPSSAGWGERNTRGKFVGFDDAGRLRLESGGQVVAIASGEVIEE